tara:strand:- start:1232 stop:2245 length:1014 start_codon:yes stop_codon:yes gene_type:complete
MKKCLVTGGCGFIGSALVQALFAAGWKVDVVDDLSTGHLENISSLKTRNLMPELLPFYEGYFEKDRSESEILVITGDFADKSVIRRVSNNYYDTVFHVAALPRVAYSIEEPVFTTETNMLKSVVLFKAAAQGRTRVVFSSSSSVYGDVDTFPQSEVLPTSPKSPYALQKDTCEKFARQFSDFYNLDIVCLRYFNVYGPGQRGDSAYSTVIAAWCEAQNAGKPVRKDGDGDQERDFTYVLDAVAANIKAAEHNGKFQGDAFNIAYGQPHSINEIHDMFRAKFGELATLEAPARPGDVYKTHAEVSKALETFGFKCKFNLKQGLSETWRWWDSLERIDG